jgi:hypothetical protein
VRTRSIRRLAPNPSSFFCPVPRPLFSRERRPRRFSYEAVRVLPLSEGDACSANAYEFRGELFTLMPPNSSCYPYDMDNSHNAPHSPASPKIARPPLPAKIIFDGTKLSVEPRRPQTTTYDRNCSFQMFSITQNFA